MRLDGHPSLKEVYVGETFSKESMSAIRQAKLSFKVRRMTEDALFDPPDE